MRNADISIIYCSGIHLVALGPDVIGGPRAKSDPKDAQSSSGPLNSNYYQFDTKMKKDNTTCIYFEILGLGKISFGLWF